MALAKELNLVGQSLVPLLRSIEEHNLDQKAAAQAYRPDIMEKELKLHAEIDRRIEKAMRRLVQAKEYKEFYGAKSIDVKQNGSNQLARQIADLSAPEITVNIPLSIVV